MGTEPFYLTLTKYTVIHNMEPERNRPEPTFKFFLEFHLTSVKSSAIL